MAKIGVVILNYKTWSETVTLTDKLLAMNSPLFDLFIEIVDNCSPNESYEYLSARYKDLPNVEVSQSSVNGGFARGNNFGLRRLAEIAPDYALVVNNDVLFEAEVLEQCVKMYPLLDRPGALAPIQYLPDGTQANFTQLKCNTFGDDLLLQFCILNKLFKRRHQYAPNTSLSNVQSVDIIPGCFMFIDYNLFSQLGFYYEGTFLYCEERFLYKKTFNANRINYILLEYNYIHNHSTTINSTVSRRRQRKLMHDGRVLFTKYYRRFPAIKIAILNIAHVVYMVESALIDLFKRKKVSKTHE